jgi:hypothetical protein
MRARKRFIVNAIGGTSVTLQPEAAAKGPEVEPGGQPNVWGTGNLVLTQGATPDATFWKAARKYLIEISVVDG